MTEDFNLDNSGTWVPTGTLRAAYRNAARVAIWCSISSSCVTRASPFVALLAWPNMQAAIQFTGKSNIDEVLADPKLRDAIRDKFAAHNAAQAGTSARVKRVLLMSYKPPSIDGHEITDKGYVNQRATLERRKALVDRLYAGGADVIEIS